LLLNFPVRVMTSISFRCKYFLWLSRHALSFVVAVVAFPAPENLLQAGSGSIIKWGGGVRESDGVYVMPYPPSRKGENYPRVWSLFSSNKLPSCMAPYMNYLVNYLETSQNISPTSALYSQHTALC
jgi:hypothetical protein